VLIVTPVIFFWLQERRLGLQHEPLIVSARSRLTPRRWYVIAGVAVTVVVAGAAIAFWRPRGSNGAEPGSARATTVQQIQSGNLVIVMLSPTGTLHQGRNTFTIEFRSASGSLVDVGTVRASANMAMPGMLMSGGLEVRGTSAPGRYQATAEFGMSGAWQMVVEWDGPAGRGSVNFQGTVQ
jgi:YtkA-like protein